MTNSQPLPFYHKFAMVLLTIVILAGIIYIGSSILMPLFFAIVLAILLLPLNNLLLRMRFPKVLAMIVSILLALLFIGGIIYFLSAQVAGFMDDLPAIKKHLNDHIHTVKQWVRTQFHVSYKEQDQAIKDATSDMKDNGSSMVGTTLFSAVQALLMLILLPLYTFLIMYYRLLIRKFLIDIFADRHKSSVEDVLKESKNIVQGYMVGLIIEMQLGILKATAHRKDYQR